MMELCECDEGQGRSHWHGVKWTMLHARDGRVVSDTNMHAPIPGDDWELLSSAPAIVFVP